MPGLCVEVGKSAFSVFLLGWGFCDFFSSQVVLHWLFFFPMSCTGVVCMALSVTHRTMFWTLSSLLLLVLAVGPHVLDAYSMVGRTVAV